MERSPAPLILYATSMSHWATANNRFIRAHRAGLHMSSHTSSQIPMRTTAGVRHAICDNIVALCRITSFVSPFVIRRIRIVYDVVVNPADDFLRSRNPDEFHAQFGDSYQKLYAAYAKHGFNVLGKTKSCSLSLCSCGVSHEPECARLQSLSLEALAHGIVRSARRNDGWYAGRSDQQKMGRRGRWAAQYDALRRRRGRPRSTTKLTRRVVSKLASRVRFQSRI